MYVDKIPRGCVSQPLRVEGGPGTQCLKSWPGRFTADRWIVLTGKVREAGELDAELIMGPELAG
jgi:hypothetical protein